MAVRRLWLLEIATSTEDAASMVLSSFIIIIIIIIIIIDVDKQKFNCSEGSQAVPARPSDKCRVVAR